MSTAAPKGGIVLFDGVCNLCNGIVRFVIARDPHGRFRFAALQSDAGRRVIAAAGVTGPLPDSIILVHEGRVHVRSGAALRIAKGLRFPWPLMFIAIIVPPILRDWVYDLIARRRYGWFGKSATCMMPTPELLERFLD